jgi:phenylacetate-coenzyme A ligase PaaK-like adenylate-forming protein
MIGTYSWKRLQDVARAARIYSDMQLRERWPRRRIDAFQRERLAALVAHASRHSPFYRELYGGRLEPDQVQLEALPVVTKAAMMEDFDRFVADPRLHRAQLDAHLEHLQDDELYLGEYRVMASSGSTGRKGLFVYDRHEWSNVLAGSMRWSALMGLRPRFPRRTRVAAVGAPDAKHMTYRGAASIDVGLFKTLRLPVTRPLAELVARLNEFQPDALTGYPSVMAMLAAEQLDGRLRIAPQVVCTSSELRTQEMSERIGAAWGSEPFDCLGLTETGVSAVDCPAHDGLHIFEDQCIFEVVDRNNRPVAAGAPGEKVLVTSLFRRTQPIIRMDVSDLLTVTDDPCACGRTFKRISIMGGRSDDILELPRLGGGTVKVHPIHLRSPLTKLPDVVQYQIVHDGDGLHVLLVLRGGAAPDAVNAEVFRMLADALRAQEAAVVPVQVQAVEQIPREAGAGKFKLVKSARRPAGTA